MGKVAWLVVAVWYLAAAIFFWKIRNDDDTAACLQSERLLTVLQYAPYKVRADALLGMVPTINTGYNVRVEFFETDNRTTDRFSIVQVLPNVIQGETNWISYRVTLNDPSEYSMACFTGSGFQTFNFVTKRQSL